MYKVGFLSINNCSGDLFFFFMTNLMLLILLYVSALRVPEYFENIVLLVTAEQKDFFFGK